jgi:nitroreductase
MEVYDAIKGRRSIRRFKKDPVEEEKIEALKVALRSAPSAGNLRMRRFYFVFNGEVKKRLSVAAFSQSFILEAPLVVVACADLRIGDYYGKRGVELYAIQDSAVSVENLMLMAHSLGLGSVWVGAFAESEVARLLALPEDLRPVAIVPVGYPAVVPSAPSRRHAGEEVVDVR